MNENIPSEVTTNRHKKIKSDELIIRRQCRITCGADVVIRHVLPYLIAVGDEESESYAESDLKMTLPMMKAMKNLTQMSLLMTRATTLRNIKDILIELSTF